MWRLVAGGLVLLLLVGCKKAEAPRIGKTPAGAGEAPRPLRPANNIGEWEDPRKRELLGGGKKR